MESKKITTVFPVHNIHLIQERIPGFRKAYEQCEGYTEPLIMLSGKDVNKDLDLLPFIPSKNVKVNEDLIFWHKMILFQRSLTFIKTPFVLVCDIDIFIPDRVFSFLLHKYNSSESFILLFDRVMLNRRDEAYGVVENSSGGVFYIASKTVKDLQPFDPIFVGYGYHDYGTYLNLVKKGIEPYRCPYPVFHQYHKNLIEVFPEQKLFFIKNLSYINRIHSDRKRFWVSNKPPKILKGDGTIDEE